MKLIHYYVGLILLFSAENLLSQSGQTGRLFIPFLDRASQSNVDVTVSDAFGSGEPCPIEYTNVLSNTNLFTAEEQILISKIFLKYKDVTTNSGPPGTVLSDLYKTNYVVKGLNKTLKVENWIANFKYTNLDACVEIRFGGGLFAKFRTKSKDGYNVSLTDVGGETLLGFGEVKNNVLNGLFVRFRDNYTQGATWNYKLADFSNVHLVEYRRYANRMILGKFLMWSSRNNNLILEAEFNEPYDLSKNTLQFKTP